MIDWRVALVVWGGFLVLAVLTRYVSLGSSWAGVPFPFATWFVYQDGLLTAAGPGAGRAHRLEAPGQPAAPGSGDRVQVPFPSKLMPCPPRAWAGNHRKEVPVMKIAVLGSGGWGTALALVLEENGHQVTLWSYPGGGVPQLQDTGENPMLQGVPLPEGLASPADSGLRAGQRRGGDGHPLLRGADHRRQLPAGSAPGDHAGLRVQGHREGHLPAPEPDHRRGAGTASRWWPCPAPPTPRRWAGRSPRRWSPPPGPGCGGAGAGPLHERPLPGVHQQRRGGGGAGGRPEERHRPVRRLLRPAWAMGTTPRPCS